MGALSKPLLASPLLPSHEPKQVTWPSPAVKRGLGWRNRPYLFMGRGRLVTIFAVYHNCTRFPSALRTNPTLQLALSALCDLFPNCLPMRNPRRVLCYGYSRISLFSKHFSSSNISMCCSLCRGVPSPLPTPDPSQPHAYSFFKVQLQCPLFLEASSSSSPSEFVLTFGCQSLLHGSLLQPCFPVALGV